jgi:hypothetical protein
MRYIAQIRQRDEDGLWQAGAALIEGEGIFGDQSDFTLDGLFNSEKEALTALTTHLDSEGYVELITKDRFKNSMHEAFIQRGFSEVTVEEYDGGATLVFTCIGNGQRPLSPPQMRKMGGWGCVERESGTTLDANNYEIPKIKYSFALIRNS